MQKMQKKEFGLSKAIPDKTSPDKLIR